MLEERLHLDASRTQNLTTTLLTMHGFFGLISAPIIVYLAGFTSSQRIPLLIALAGCFVGTLLVASTYSRMAHQLDVFHKKIPADYIPHSLGTLSWPHPAGRCRISNLGGWFCFVG